MIGKAFLRVDGVCETKELVFDVQARDSQQKPPAISAYALSTNVREYIRADGTRYQHIGGSRAWRNNNEGNIKRGDFAERHGAIGHDGSFAIFPTVEIGRKQK